MHAAHSRGIARTLAACAWLALAGNGCLLFPSKTDSDSFSRSPLRPLVPPREVIDLEVFFVDRRIGDPLIGEGLWSSLCAVTAVAPDVREQLAEDGFRFGMAPPRPPRSLQALMRLSNGHDPSQRVVYQRMTVPAGGTTQLVVSQVPDGTPLIRRTSESIQTIDLIDAQCLLNVQVEVVDDGWAKLVIVPEIRHGAQAMRPLATDQEFLFREGQRSQMFYQDRLSAEVNVREIVVLGLNSDAPAALASHFFRADVSQGIERLILIRVAEMRKIKPVRVESE